MVPLLLVTAVGTILVTWLLPMAFKSDPPYGLVVDIGAGTLVALVWAYVTYEFLAPFIGMTGWLRFVGSAGDAIGFGAVILWVLRRIAK
jgi:hypothetical protein